MPRVSGGMFDLKKAGRDLATGLLNFVYPPLCLACNRELESGLVCDRCLADLDRFPLEVCPRCGWPVAPGESCPTCGRDVSVVRVRALGRYSTPLKELVHHLKYGDKRSLANILGSKMAALLASDPVLKRADLVVPVPLHPARRRERGYNQSELLARAIGEFAGIAMVDGLKRRKNTRSQARLSPAQRLVNVKDAFAVRPGCTVRDKRIILVDDVSTSGATLDAAGRALIAAGAAEVYGLVAAWA